MNTAEEISLNQVLHIFTRRWKYLLLLALVFTLGALVKHKYLPMYPGTGKLIIKDVRNSQLQLILSTVTGQGGEFGALDPKGDDVVDRAEILLDTHEYFVALADRLIKNNSRSIAVEQFLKRFKVAPVNPEFIHDVASALAYYISFSPNKGGVLTVTAKTPNRELSTIMVNEALDVARTSLLARELKDLNQAEIYFMSEIGSVRGRLDSIENSTIKKLQKNQILSVDVEKGDSSKYISELKKNINDTRILIASNDSRIKALNSRIVAGMNTDNGVMSKFNESSQVKILQEENQELDIELQTYMNYLRNFESQKTGLVPFQYEIQKMNASHDLEYKVYASLNESLARIGLQKTYVKNKIEILEKERYAHVRSSPGIIIMMLLALLISQVIGMFSIYIYELFQPSEVKFIAREEV
jgi:uncharacterized protein involved in exopolysaccharide biosynthesis